MKNLAVLIFILVLPFWVSAQTQTPDFGTCFGKGNKKSVIKKMDNFMSRVSEETGCPKEKITYKVDDYFTGFYSKECRHLPKRITFDACGEKRTYKHGGISGAILYWVLGSWTLEKK